MMKILLFTIAMIMSCPVWAQNDDFLLKKDFQQEKKKMAEGIDAAKKAGIDARRMASSQVMYIDSLLKIQSANEAGLAKTNDSLKKTTARLNDLEARSLKDSTNSGNLLIMTIIVTAILFLLFLAMVFFMKNKTDEKLRELSEDNMQLAESMKHDFSSLSQEIRKTTSVLAQRLDQTEEKEKALARELDELIGKIVKEQSFLKEAIDDKFHEILSQISIQNDEQKALHDKINSDVDGLRSLHVKDVEDIKAKF